MGKWYCPYCEEELEPSRVTYQENCDSCGHSVQWIEEDEDMILISRERAEKLFELELNYEKKIEQLESIKVNTCRKNRRKIMGKRGITERSNVIQYDDMGYPLRLCIMSDSRQVWIDTDEEDGDVVLKWSKVE